MNKNLTATQSDYAKFLPATSTFYSTFVGKQRHFNYVDPTRIPPSFAHGAESLNYLDPDKGAFYYHWCLYSAGHANLDLKVRAVKTTAPASVAAPSFSAWSVNTTVTAR